MKKLTAEEFATKVMENGTELERECIITDLYPQYCEIIDENF